MAKRTKFQWEGDSESSSPPERISRSEKKRQALALQELGARLVQCEVSSLAFSGLPRDLRCAVGDYAAFSSREAKRRQLQYIGRLMRELSEEDLEAVKAALGEQT
ncbi:MAG: DUF615 domain-containing protein [Desulfovibrio sp.]|nr:DUF615 domain-containing protein [Desulfovibrio sp.]